MNMIHRTYDWLDPYTVVYCAEQIGASDVCLLQSSSSDSQRHTGLSRYTFLGVNPFASVRADNGNVYVSRGGMKHRVNDSAYTVHPLDVVGDMLADYTTTHVADLPPFQCGAMGWFGYDMGRYTENLPPHRGDTDGVFPQGELAVGLYAWCFAFDILERVVHFMGYSVDGVDIHSQADFAHTIITMARNTDIRLPDTICGTPITSALNQEQHEDAVQRIIDYIGKGDIFQANMTNQFRLAYSGASPLDVYGLLQAKNPAPFSAYIGGQDFTIASSSPERFLSLSANGVVETRPIKGTAKKQSDTTADAEIRHALETSPKDRAENIMIVDLLRNDLSKVCRPETVHTHVLCGLETYESVHHLVSVIQATPRDGMGATDILKACFPGGSITGAPRIRAQEIIAELEPVPRGVYCGAMGYLGWSGTMDTNIAIRTMILDAHTVVFHAGGGIVWDSNPFQEYLESLVKAEKMASVFGQSVLYGD